MLHLILPLLVLVGYPVFLLLFFRANAGILFLAACASLVLLDSLDPTIVTTAGAILPGEGEAYVRLLVIIFSLTFASMIYRNTAKSSLLPFHVVEIVLLVAVLACVLPYATGVSWIVAITKESAWKLFSDFKTLFIASGFALSLLLLLVDTKLHHHAKKEKH